MLRRRFALILLLVVACCGSVTGAVAQAQMSPEEFRSAIAARLQRLIPDRKFEAGRELELLLTNAMAAKPYSFFLDNTYKDYLEGRETLDSAAKRLAAAYSESNSADESPFRSDRLVPLIRHRDLLRTRSPSGKSLDLQYETLAGDLIVVFAEDGEKTLRLLSTEKFSELGVPAQNLRAIAAANLRDRLGASQAAIRDGVHFVLTPTGYGASRILLDEFWQDARSKVSGDPVFAVPDRDVILLTGSGDRKGMQAIGVMANNIARRFGHAVSGSLYSYRDGRIEPFTR